MKTLRLLLPLFALVALAPPACKTVDSALLTATPGVQPVSNCNIGAYRCDGDIPEVCSESQRWWSVLPPDVNGLPQHCASGCVLSAGIAHCGGGVQ